MSPGLQPIELVDVEAEADGIAEDFTIARADGDVRAMRGCFERLIRNHRAVVHTLAELCDDVSKLKGDLVCGR